MLVHERMSRNPYTITDETPVEEALKRMREFHVRRFPVMNKAGKLVGIVAERDLLYASPSPATSLSIYELHYLLSRLTVAEVMTKDVVTITEDTPVEDAARIMTDRKIGSLPVVRDGHLVGIITETDLFKLFLELLGARQKGVRVTMLLPDVKGTLAKVTGRLPSKAATSSRWAPSWAKTRPIFWWPSKSPTYPRPRWSTRFSRWPSRWSTCEKCKGDRLRWSRA